MVVEPTRYPRHLHCISVLHVHIGGLSKRVDGVTRTLRSRGSTAQFWVSTFIGSCNGYVRRRFRRPGEKIGSDEGVVAKVTEYLSVLAFKFH